MATPFLRVLRERYEDEFISVLCRDYVSELLERCSFIDRLVVYDKGKGIRGALRALKGLRPDSGWDAAFVLPLSFSSALIAFLSGSLKRIGHSSGIRTILLTDGLPGGRLRTKHLSRIYIELLQSSNEDAAVMIPYPSVIPPYNWIDRLAKLGIEGDYLVLAAGATYGPAKLWAPENYSRIARTIYDRWNLHVIVVGSIDERPGLDKILEGSGVPGRNLAGECGVSDLSTVLRGSSLVIGNDSGPVHISASMGIPTVAIFGSTNPVWTAPRGPRVKVLSASVECSPCYERECPDGSYRCMKEITSDDVLEMAGEIMREAAGDQRN
jgi:heptosyltransferase-2